MQAGVSFVVAEFKRHLQKMPCLYVVNFGLGTRGYV